jgi:uncharacterized protein YjdB
MKQNKLGANIALYLFAFCLLCVIIYPHTRLAHTDPIHKLGSKHLNKTNVTLKVGESFSLYIVGVNRRATYKSTDFKVASVGINGKVYALRKGDAVIIVKQKELRLSCKVTVIE